MYAIPASSAPATRARDNSPGTSSASRRTVPFEKTASFSSRAKAARSKPARDLTDNLTGDPTGERQEEITGGQTAVVLLEFDQDAEESAQTQLRNLLLSPDIIEDLTGITFPTGDDPASADSEEHNSELQGSNYPNPKLFKLLI